MSDIQPEYNWKSPVDTYRWLKAQMDREGYKGSVLSYQPKGYHKVFTAQSADPNVTYWKPYEVSRTNALAPMAVYRHDTEKQTYWEDPANIGQWRDYLMLQEDDFVAPPYIDSVSYTHLRAHETVLDLVCRLPLEKKKQSTIIK